MHLLNNFFSKFLIFGSIILCSSFFNIYKVNAGYIDLSSPNRSCADSINGSTSCGKVDIANYWDNPYYSNKLYLGDPGSTGTIYHSINFQWDDINLCKGKTILISGTIAGLFDFFNNSYSIDVYNNGSKLSCNYSLENSSRLKYICSGTGGGKFQINVNQLSFNTQKTYTIAVSKVVDITCDVGNSDIITNNNNNTQNIINNNNKNTQDIINNQNQNSQNTQQKIDNIDDTLKDSSIDSDNASSSANDWNNKNASNGTITNLLTLPIQLMQGYVNGMNSICTPFNLGNLFGTTIILPCINVGNLVGSSLWSVIDVLFSGFMIFSIAKKLIKIFNDFTNMKSNQVDELYGGGA